MPEPLYSGPTKSGTCVCGHSWDSHHLHLVMRQDYVDQTKEGYLPGECLHYGSNEAGGLMFLDGEWVEHCRGYRDTFDKNSK